MKRLLIVLLLLAPVALPGLAHASPPDPTWIQGIYDDDDGDSIITQIFSGTGHVPAPVDLPLVAPLIGTLTTASGPISLRVWVSSAQPRAPPAR